MAALRLSVKNSRAYQKRALLLYKVAAHDHHERRHGRAVKSLEECVKICGTHKGAPGTLDKDAPKLLGEAKRAELKKAEQTSGMGGEAADRYPGNGALAKSKSTKISRITQQSKPDVVRSTSKAAVALHRRDDASMKKNIKHFQQILDWCQKKYGADHLDTGR